MSDKEILEEYLITNNEELFILRLKYKEAERMNDNKLMNYYSNLTSILESRNINAK